jgi:hypothetical protein
MKKLWIIIAVCFWFDLCSDAGQAHAGTTACAVNISDNQLITFNTDNPASWAVIGSTAAKEFYAGDFLDGDNTTLYAISRAENNLYTIDTATAVEALVGACTPHGDEYWTGLTASVDGILYASSTNLTRSTLYTINPSTGAAKVIGQITSAPGIIDIAINTSGHLYGADIFNDTLVSINPATGAGTVVGPLGINIHYAQGMSFDWNTGVLYLAAYGGSSDGALRTVDTATGTATLVESFPGGHEVDCLAFHACLDNDHDGYGIGCSPGPDCNDNNTAVHPGVADTTCDGIDQNCDGSFDEGSTGPFATYYLDSDDDGYGSKTAARVCTGHVPDHYVTDNSDCNDYNAGTLFNTFFRDADGDGYGDGGSVTEACDAPAGYVSDNADCNDTDGFLQDICPDCSAVVLPRALGLFLGETKKNRVLIVIGSSEAVFKENTAVRWDTDAIEVIKKWVFFKRVMFMQASIDGANLDKGEFRALIGNCSAKLNVIK